MSVKIIRHQGKLNYSIQNKKVRIEFKDGSHMFGYVNIHSKFVENESEEVDYQLSVESDNLKYKFNRLSDYLKDCNQNEGMITVFDSRYGGVHDRVCFVFLHSVKFITEEYEKDQKDQQEQNPPAMEEESKPEVERTEFSLRDRLRKSE